MMTPESTKPRNGSSKLVAKYTTFTLIILGPEITDAGVEMWWNRWSRLVITSFPRDSIPLLARPAMTTGFFFLNGFEKYFLF